MARTRFETRYWTARLPDGWRGEHAGVGAAIFQREPVCGVLQISGFICNGNPASDDDLLGLIGSEQAELLPGCARLGRLTGFFNERPISGLRWSRWWLAAGKLIVFASYIVPDSEEYEAEQNEAEELIASLWPKV